MTQAFRAHLAGSAGEPAQQAFMEPTPKHIRTMFGGEVIADSKNVLIMHETNHVPAYYFPMDDLRSEFLEPTTHTTH